MVLTSLALALALQVPIPAPIQMVNLPEPDGKPVRLMMQVRTAPLDVPKRSPAHAWDFDWVTSGYGNQRTDGTGQYDLKFSVFSQDRKPGADSAFLATRMLLRLWEYNFSAFGIDNNPNFHQGIVDVYLCFGGKPGGEQMFDLDPQVIPPIKVNTIYIYDLDSFKGAVEMAREVAHEFGHASLPPVGGFKKPEDWANGYLGERLFLRYLRDQIAAGRLTPDDTMGATGAQLDAWVKANVDPLVSQAAKEGPNATLLGSTGPEAMNSYMGLALYAAAILPPKTFARSMMMNGTMKAADYPSAIAVAAEEGDRYPIQVPPSLQGQEIWIPLGKGRIEGANVVERRQEWAKIKPTGEVWVTPRTE